MRYNYLMINEVRSTDTNVTLACANDVTLACGNDVTLACGNDVTIACGNDVILACGNDMILVCGNDVILACGNGVTLACAVWRAATVCWDVPQQRSHTLQQMQGLHEPLHALHGRRTQVANNL